MKQFKCADAQQLGKILPRVVCKVSLYSGKGRVTTWMSPLSSPIATNMISDFILRLANILHISNSCHVFQPEFRSKHSRDTISFFSPHTCSTQYTVTISGNCAQDCAWSSSSSKLQTKNIFLAAQARPRHKKWPPANGHHHLLSVRGKAPSLYQQMWNTRS